MLRTVLSLFLVWGIVAHADEKIPKQHYAQGSARNLSVSINSDGTKAVVVGSRDIPPAGSGATIGSIELVDIATGLSDGAFHQAQDPDGHFKRAEDPFASDAGVIYVNPGKNNRATDC